MMNPLSPSPSLTRRATVSAFLAGLLLILPAFVAAAPALPTSLPASVLIVGGTMMNGSQFADSTLPVMREHYRGCRRVALVLHASHPTERDRMETRLQAAFAHLGVPAADSLHRRDAAGARKLLAAAELCSRKFNRAAGARPNSPVAA